jgi:hypothetical protein
MMLMIKIFRYFFVTAVLLSAGSLYGQQTFSNQWLSASVRAKIADNFYLDLEEGWRISDWTVTSATYTDLMLSYKINKQFRIGAGYRHIQRGGFVDADNFDHRFYSDFSFREKFGDIKLTARTRFQSRYRDPFTSETGMIPQLMFRNKAELSYNLPGPFLPYISYEHFLLVKEAKNRGPYSVQQRMQIGLEYSISKQSSIAVGYIYQNELNSKNPETDHILNISFGYNINASKSDK